MKSIILDHWWKVVLAAVTAAMLTWGSYVTLLAQRGVFLAEKVLQKANKTEAYVDMQVKVLHSRDTAQAVGQEADETRLENRLWELQLRFFEDVIADLEEELAAREGGKK